MSKDFKKPDLSQVKLVGARSSGEARAVDTGPYGLERTMIWQVWYNQWLQNATSKAEYDFSWNCLLKLSTERVEKVFKNPELCFETDDFSTLGKDNFDKIYNQWLEKTTDRI